MLTTQFSSETQLKDYLEAYADKAGFRLINKGYEKAKKRIVFLCNRSSIHCYAESGNSSNQAQLSFQDEPTKEKMEIGI